MRRFIGTAAALIAFASPAFAQGAPSLRHGFTISFGMGAGSAAFSYEGNDSDRIGGPSGYLRIGGALSPRFVLAGETHGWTHRDGDVTSQVGYLMAVGQWYPSASGGFHLIGGLGGAMISEEDDAPGGYQLESVGGAVQLGLGYDIRMTRNFSLTPYANFLAMGGGEPRFSGVSAGGSLSSNVFQFGLGFSWH